VNLDLSHYWRQQIEALPVPDTPFNLLNVCGGHERSITQAGLRSTLPHWLNLIPGPGCPVCVCPEIDIALAIAMAHQTKTILASFGDMLRVPINTLQTKNFFPKKIRSLALAKASGLDVRPIASPIDAKNIALQNPTKTVVFFAAGFETTMAPVAALVQESLHGTLPGNLQFLISGRRTWPAVHALLTDDRSTSIDGMIAPGHVATVMGTHEWQKISRAHQLPTAIAGFENESLLHAFYCVLQQSHLNHPQVDNCYTQVVKPEGNRTARAILLRAFAIKTSQWRGIGAIPDSGFTLRSHFNDINARVYFSDVHTHISDVYAHAPRLKGCQCADVVMARCRPNQCTLYAKTCTPREPIGPCMVSDEGACRIWWANGMPSQTAASTRPA